ncbi:MAG TPA: PPK2 family polyphosphate kinase [Stellaceae bacterium]|jgi:PPK2 family polyphosphate:nucleotide phosphotransferase|nr:PPK2 family polyphosphate kinase [Stellaceae bacterium]
MLPTANLGALERYRVPTDWKGALSDIDPHDREAIPFPRPEAEAATAADIAEIDRLQEVLYAQAKYALLVVLQGPDTSGKDGTIRRVFSPINPLGAVATSFKKPTPHELAHDFLWRIHNAAPAAGMIGIFNRSHYEDVLVPRVHRLVPAERIEARYRQINAFEQHLVENDVIIVKFYLHVSNKEQKSRLEARLKDPTKRWKFSADDLAERKHWDDYISAYETALQRCSTKWAPWFIVPADRKWYRDAVVARIVLATLEALDLTYPPEMPGLDNIRID